MAQIDIPDFEIDPFFTKAQEKMFPVGEEYLEDPYYTGAQAPLFGFGTFLEL